MRVCGSQARVGMLAGLLPLLAACGAPELPPPPADVRLEGVRVWRHEGLRLVARAEAATARLDPEGRVARLADGRVDLVGPGLRITAPEVELDLHGREVTGRGGVRVEGDGLELTGPRFRLDLVDEQLTISGGVEARGEVAR